MPVYISPTDYGFANAADLAKMAGTLQGETKVGGNLYDRAVIADVLFNRAYGGDPIFARYNTTKTDGTTYTGPVGQAANPVQFNVWMPTIAGKANGGYQSGTEMQGIISNLIKDPTSWDRLSPTQQQNVSMNLTALRGVFGSYDPNKGNLPNGEGTYTPQGGPLQGITGGATYYSNPKYNAPSQMATHINLGLNQGVNHGDNVFYAGNPAKTQEMAQRMRAFDRLQAATELSVGDATEGGFRENDAGMLARMAFRGPDLPSNGTSLPLPPGRPSDADLQSYAQALQGGPLDRFSDGITQGLQSAGNSILDTFSGALNRLPTAEEFRGRINDIQTGARSLFDQLTDIAASPEAKTFAQSTGIDPSRYVLDDIYRLGLNRGVDAPSAASQMEVLRNQGGQSLYNQLINSQEGRTLALGNFYENNLNRGIDQGGLGKYLSDLAAGKSMQAVQTDILSSPEAQALGIQPDQFASIIGSGATQYPVGPGQTQYPIGPVSTTYPVGPGGFEVGTVPPGPTQGTINTGTEVSPVGPGGFEVKPVGPEGSEVGTVPPLALSPEVRNFYETYLHRAPDAQGAIEYQGQIDRGVSPSIVEAQILGSPEAVQALSPDEMASQTAGYKAKYGLLPEEVKTLAPLASDFARVLDRPADTKTLAYWDQELDAGTPMSVLEARILTAPETQAVGLPALTQAVQDYQTQYALKPEETLAVAPLASEFARVLDRPADLQTIQAWDAQLDGGATLPQLTAQLLQAPEVLGRTGGAGDAYSAFQGQYGRSPVDYLAALSDPTKFSGAYVSGNVGPGSFNGFNGAEYLAANRDVAASGMDPLAHFVKYGLSEGRALDTAGDRLPQGFDGTAYLAQNQDVARSGMNPLEHYLRFGAAEGRAAPTGNNPTAFSNINAAQGLGPTGNGTFSGTFNPADYFAANKDVAASGMNALDHYLRYGYGEGRAIDTLGDQISGFDGTAYLAANRDVAMAGMDPLRHYLMSGAAEGRALPTGSNNYSFSNFNVAGGLGNPGTGSFGLGGITSTAPGGMGTMQTPAPQASNPISPFGFSNLNVGAYQVPGGVGQVAGDDNGGAYTPNIFGPNGVVTSPAPGALPGSGTDGRGSAFAYTDNNGRQQIATFNPDASENAYLAGQVAQNQQQIEAGRTPFANNPNLANAQFAQQNYVMQAQNQFTPTPFFTAAPATYALPAPAPAPFIAPPVMAQGLRVNPYGGFGLISAF